MLSLLFSITIVSQQSFAENANQHLLNFHPSTSLVETMVPSFKYVLTDGAKLTLGEEDVSASDISMQLMQLNPEQVETVTGISSPNNKNLNLMLFYLPKSVPHFGKVTLIASSGKVLDRITMTEQRRQEWENSLLYGKKNPEEEDLLPERMSTVRTSFEQLGISYERPPVFGAMLNPKKWVSHKKGDRFRFCFETELLDNKFTTCSQYYQILWNKDDRKPFLKPFGVEVEPRLEIDGNRVDLAGTFVNFKKFNLKAVFRNGSGVDFSTAVPKIQMHQIYVSKEDENLIYLEGFNQAPSDPSPEFIYKKDHSLFAPTINNLPDWWKVQFRKNEPFVTLSDLWGIGIKSEIYDLSIPQLGSEDVFSSKPSMIHTYKSSFSTQINISENTKVSHLGKGIELSESESSDSDDESEQDSNRKYYEFSFSDLKKRSSHDLRFSLTSGEKNWKTGYEIYRASPGEFSTRLTGILSDVGGVAVLPEFNFRYWFESILGSEAKWLSHQRWGIETSYAAGQTSVELGDDSGFTYSRSTFNLKYRFQPGVWERDPFWGLVLERQQVTLNEANLDVSGIGIVWARSMPRLFDPFFDAILRVVGANGREKWVHAEFIYYPMNHRGDDVILGQNYAINFQGKTQVSESFFLGGGLGFRQFDFTDLEIYKRVDILLFYGTLSLGYNF